MSSYSHADCRVKRVLAVTWLVGCLWLSGCSSSGGGSDDSANTVDPVITPNLAEIPVGGIAVDLGRLDARLDAVGGKLDIEVGTSRRWMVSDSVIELLPSQKTSK